VTPPPALAGERIDFPGAGQLSAYVAGQGPPLLLVHSINATGSAAEVRPLFERLQSTHTVFAIDLPGYGFSERSDREYTPRLMTDALHAMAAEVRRRCALPQDAALDALAVSLSTEFLARAASEQPRHWGRLALVSPTGFNGRRPLRGPPGSTRGLPWLRRVLAKPLWSQALFNGLTRPGVVRFFLRGTFGSRDIDEAMWAYGLLSARVPGARFAPLSFLSGQLFSADIHTVYEALTQPVWMSQGTRGDFTDFRSADLVRGRPNWSFSVYEGAGALPYFQQPQRFQADLLRWLQGANVDAATGH